ncbi:unnamed protein product [Fusarium venenatum]|uniref:Uncharacterized protein n=1 Tax=Fusarium venenatum TaxID=56646 RepID=A0A2L2TG16_9HYPO|nr:uncharacterized protein FVRRES_00883 [Fusarium venenatum]CEI64371.1 unnamed protein product [Fusarium venenatum]
MGFDGQVSLHAGIVAAAGVAVVTKNISVGLTSFPVTRVRTLAACKMTRHPQCRCGNTRWQYGVAPLDPDKPRVMINCHRSIAM